MKKVLSAVAVSAFVLTAGVALAGGPGQPMDCPEPCQQQVDMLNSSQAQQDEQLDSHTMELDAHEGRLDIHESQLANHESRLVTLEDAFDDYWYVRLGAGASWVDGEQVNNDGYNADTNFVGQVAFGREFAMYNAPGKFRAELEFAYLPTDGNFDVDPAVEWDIDAYTFMVNGYYELPVAQAFSVYGMVGMGMADISADNNIDDTDHTAFAYKMGLGATYNFTNTIAGDFGYEYLSISDVAGMSDIDSSNLIASVRFKF